MWRLSLNRSEPAKKSGQNIPKNRCRTTIAERIVETGDIAKARAVRRLVGDGFPLAFDANNGYSVGGAVRVGRVLEDSAIGGSRSRCSIIMSKRCVRFRGASTSQFRLA